MLEPLVVKATRAVPRRERRSNPPDLSNEVKEVIPCPYQTPLLRTGRVAFTTIRLKHTL